MKFRFSNLLVLTVCILISPTALAQGSQPQYSAIGAPAYNQNQTTETPNNFKPPAYQSNTKDSKETPPSAAVVLSEMQSKLAVLKIESNGQMTPEVVDMIREIAKTYRRVPSDSIAVDLVMQQAFENYYTNAAFSKSASQATQSATEGLFRLNMIQVAQNQRIIELLQLLITKK